MKPPQAYDYKSTTERQRSVLVSIGGDVVGAAGPFDFDVAAYNSAEGWVEVFVKPLPPITRTCRAPDYQTFRRFGPLALKWKEAA